MESVQWHQWLKLRMATLQIRLQETLALRTMYGYHGFQSEFQRC